MKLYIKQKVFSWADKFTVKDENGNDRYTVDGEVFTLGRKLHVRDMRGSEVAFIKEKVWSWMARYQIFTGEHMAAEVVKEFTLLRPKYHIEGPGWDVNGSFWTHDYQVTKNGRPIVSIQKEWMTWGDSYVLDIADPRDEIVALAVVLTIDCVLAAQSSS